MRIDTYHHRKPSHDARGAHPFHDKSTASQGDETGLVSCNNINFGLRENFKENRETVSTKGTFSQQSGTYDGTQRRLFWGTFDVQHDSETGPQPRR